MIYEEKTPGMPSVLRREGGEEVVWKRVPEGEVGESHDSFAVLSQEGR